MFFSHAGQFYVDKILNHRLFNIFEKYTLFLLIIYNLRLHSLNMYQVDIKNKTFYHLFSNNFLLIQKLHLKQKVLDRKT